MQNKNAVKKIKYEGKNLQIFNKIFYMCMGFECLQFNGQISKPFLRIVVGYEKIYSYE